MVRQLAGWIDEIGEAYLTQFLPGSVAVLVRQIGIWVVKGGEQPALEIAHHVEKLGSVKVERLLD